MEPTESVGFWCAKIDASKIISTLDMDSALVLGGGVGTGFRGANWIESVKIGDFEPQHGKK